MDGHDVMIIGSGHNALVTAAYLARAGRSVLLLERNDRPGGLVRTKPFNQGDPSLAGFRYDGVSFPDGRTAVLPRSMDAMVDEADRLSPGDGAAFADLRESFAPYAGGRDAGRNADPGGR